MPAERILLVRHGNYNRKTEELNEEGQDQSAIAGETCLGMVGPDAVILSSTRLRAMQTAGIIADVLSMDRGSVLPSPRMGRFGEQELGIRNLDETIAIALHEAGFVQDDPFNLIVVTHQPLIDLARESVYKGPLTDFVSTANGQVFDYERGTWRNPDYRHHLALLENSKVEYDLKVLAQGTAGSESAD
ncbi:MAG: hypothetical protein QG623_66 [Patescibacteria group bacterium]|nr:hypothetical protein [Patescibacteria group bacterium]